MAKKAKLPEINPLSNSLIIPVVRISKQISSSHDKLEGGLETSRTVTSNFDLDITPSITIFNPKLFVELMLQCSPHCCLLVFVIMGQLQSKVDKQHPYKEKVKLNREEIVKLTGMSLRSVVTYIKELTSLSIIYPVAGEVRTYWTNPNFFHYNKAERMKRYEDKIQVIK